MFEGVGGGGGEVGEEDLRNYAGNARHGQGEREKQLLFWDLLLKRMEKVKPRLTHY